ncbi:Surface layer protein [Anoxybacillus ayderensis]|uniref:Surface layer protein n=1 Tax=Anoxybacillus ayderensis TaxID=265546 RepID=UPI002E2425BE|nr:Surface layer protein [Anoxybacillus ayderensis]
MSTKKIINMTVIGFILFSLLLSFQPIVSEAKTNVATIVNEAKVQMKKAHTTYTAYVQKTGSIPPHATVLAEYKKAHQLYVQAKQAVQKSAGKEKKKYVSELDGAYKTYMAKRVIPYLNASVVFEGSKKMRTALEQAIVDEDMDALRVAHKQLQVYVQNRQLRVYNNVSEANVRKLLLGEFSKSKALYDKYANDVKVYEQLLKANEYLEDGKLAEAKKVLDAVNALLSKLSDTFRADLTNEYNNLSEVYNDLITPPVAELDYVEATNGALTLYFDIPVSSLNAANMKITVAINKGEEQVVQPATITLSEDRTVATIVVPTISEKDEEQSVVYAVEYAGKKVTADPFVISKK